VVGRNLFFVRFLFPEQKKKKINLQAMGQDVLSQVFASARAESKIKPLLDAIEKAKFGQEDNVGACLVAPNGKVLLEMTLIDTCNWRVDEINSRASFRVDDVRASDSEYLARLYPGVSFRTISWDATDFPSDAWETLACYDACTQRFTQSTSRAFVAPKGANMPASWPSGIYAARAYFREHTERMIDDLIEQGDAWRPQIVERLEQLFPRNTKWQLQNGRMHYDHALTFDVRASGMDPPSEMQLQRAIALVVGQEENVTVSFITEVGRWHARIQM
jgi:hypothetical protein